MTKRLPATTITICMNENFLVSAVARFGQVRPTVIEVCESKDRVEIEKFIRRYQIYAVQHFFDFLIEVPYSAGSLTVRIPALDQPPARFRPA